MKHIPLKVCEGNGAGLAKALRAYVKDNYPEAERKLYDEAIDAVGNLRQKVVDLTTDDVSRENGDLAVQTLRAYLKLLVEVKGKFPFGESTGGGMFKKAERVKYLFQWSDAFLTRSVDSVGHHDIKYEIACTVFSLGAAYTLQGMVKDRSSADGLKECALSCLKAAGIFTFLESNAVDYSFSDATNDMKSTTHKWIKDFMIAQAAGSTFENAKARSMKPDTLAKLALGASGKFGEAETLGSSKEMKWLKDCQFPYVKYITYQKYMFEAAGHYWAAKQDNADSEYGREIARLQQAEASIEQAKKVEPAKMRNLPKSREELSKAIRERLVKAISDNEQIYAMAVPKIDDLPPIERKVVGTPVAFSLETLDEEKKS